MQTVMSTPSLFMLIALVAIYSVLMREFLDGDNSPGLKVLALLVGAICFGGIITTVNNEIKHHVKEAVAACEAKHVRPFQITNKD